MSSPPSSPDKKAYFEKQSVEPILVEALKAASQNQAQDACEFIGHFMLERSPTYAQVHKNGGASAGHNGASKAADDAAAYAKQGAFGIASNRTKWLLGFLFGLLGCASVMHEFEALLAKEIELAFFVPLLIGHGGNSGGQTVSTVIRALGSGAIKLSDAPRVVLKEAAAGLMQGAVLTCALAPTLAYGMGITQKVTTIVCLALPCLGFIANTLGALLPFVVTWCGADPAVIVGPLMTTSVDSLGLMTYLLIATTYISFMGGDEMPQPQCHRTLLAGCRPSNDVTTACEGGLLGKCIAVS